LAVIGIDYGQKRIGIAINESGVLATPHGIIENPGAPEAAAELIAALASSAQADLLVLGIPRRSRRDEQLEKRFEMLAELLRQKTCSRVVLWDEAFSTTEAASMRRDRGRRNRTPIDAEAASVILQSYLDERGGRP
jgi:putative transcription antitermination factor YqgF